MPQIAGPTSGYRVVQIHPLLKCNLRCRHCYSTSGPDALAALPLERIRSALELLRQEGFNAAGISGGEPLLYQALPELLRHAREIGLLATVTTNAMLLDDARADMLRQCADLVAVSLDGPPESHNRMRGHPQAFERMIAGVECLRRAAVPFGFIFTLTFENLHELDWISEFAVARGAALLQVHPLEEVGRAAGRLPGSAPDALELARAFVEVARLQEQYSGKLTIQYDVADLEVLAARPDRVFAIQPCAAVSGTGGEAAPLGDLIAPVIVEADGALVPLQYNFSRAYQIGSIGSSDLPGQIAAWKREAFPRFLSLCRGVYDRLLQDGATEFPFVNWYGRVLEASHLAARHALQSSSSPAHHSG